MNIKIGIINVPKHDNKHDLIYFVTYCLRYQHGVLFVVHKEATVLANK